MAPDYQVIKVDEEMRFDDLGTPATRMRVLFKVGAHGPFVRYFAKEGFQSFQVMQELEAFARDLRALQG